VSPVTPGNRFILGLKCQRSRSRSTQTVLSWFLYSCECPLPLVYFYCGGRCACRWEVGAWSQCSVTCGEGTQQRAVSCTSESGDCASPIPASRQACDTGSPCPQWQAAPWSQVWLAVMLIIIGPLHGPALFCSLVSVVVCNAACGLYDTIRYDIITCAHKLTIWSA